jgi:hypothetical protein
MSQSVFTIDNIKKINLNKNTIDFQMLVII